MFRTVEHINLSGNGLRGNEVRVLRHVARPVHFAFVVDFLNDLDTRLWRDGMATKLTAFVIVVCTIELVRGGAIVAFRKVYLGDLEVVLRLSGRVCAEQ